jgi:CRISPR-associated protein Cas5t
MLRLYMEAPIFYLRKPQARNQVYESFVFPPPSSLYGMLLSYIGEVDKTKYEGTELALAQLKEMPKSMVCRKIWRMKAKELTDPTNRTPIRQELYTGLAMSIWVKGSFADKLEECLEHPERIKRFGPVSIGESTNFVNDLRLWRDSDLNTGQLLVKDEDGFLGLTVWTDHVGTKSTWHNFSLVEQSLDTLPDSAWCVIRNEQAATVC